MKKREKNWCPFVDKGEVHVVYSLYPELVILRKDNKNGYERIFSEKSAYFHRWVAENVDLLEAVHIGGGSNFIKYGNLFIGTFHVKYVDLEYRSFVAFIAPDFSVKKIIGIDYGDSLFQGKRLRKLRAELVRDETASTFFVAPYRLRLRKVVFASGIFLKENNFYISIGINDLVTKVAIFRKDKIDAVIESFSGKWKRPEIG
ncbi:MAG: hypothetical protein HOC23_19570 [Halieaceae bacterium]|nr:hypothetical protein [Halieaceae bacterium]